MRRSGMLFAVLLICTSVGLCGISHAQEASGGSKGATVSSAGQFNDCDDPLTRKQGEFAVKYIDFQIEQMQINVQKFEWQSRASEVVLWLVVILTIAGICFAGYQLYVSATIGAKNANTTLEVSLKHIRIQTAITGVSVLVISIVFLHLFLQNVYEIKFVNLSGPGVVQAKNVETQ
jgi:hypothetical protein